MYSVLIWWTRRLATSSGDFPLYYYIVIIMLYAVHQVVLYVMFVSLMSFHAKISDPTIGGTYMTFLNTITNLGGNWPATLSLFLIDKLSLHSCQATGQWCNTDADKDVCTKLGSECSLFIDGYYLETFICTLLGLMWFLWGKSQVHHLQNRPQSSWRSHEK